MGKIRSRSIFLAIILALLLLGAAGFVWLFTGLPSVEELGDRLLHPGIRIVDRNGKLLYEVIAEESGRHVVFPFEKIPEACKRATIATEDRSFYRNSGMDLRGVLRSVWINLQGGNTIAGGSTITQQVARNLLMDDSERSERTLRRKLREIILAWKLTASFEKDDILALYLNQTYYGGMAYGIESAAQTYFGKSVERLDLAECALLAGMPQAPAVYNPFSNPDASRERQQVVLGLMQDAGLISAGQAQLAGDEKLVFAESPYPIEAPHFVMLVRNQIDRLFSPEQVYESGGLVIRTTLDLDWQKHAERAVLTQLEKLAKAEGGLGHNMNNAALVAVDPHTGDVLTMVGSPDYFDVDHAGAINMAVTPRQPGSALKPLVYAAALSQESGWTAATMLLDVRTDFLTLDGKAYTPQNYDLREHGPVLVREALASSLNIPAVIALQHIGLDRLFNLSQKMGIDTLEDPQDYDLSLALGGGAVRLLDLSAAYGVFANGGSRVEPRFILDVHDLSGDLLYAAPASSQVKVLDPRIAWLISDILSDNDARRLGFGANSALRLDRPAAVKTGTTSNFHDNWTVGYTPDLVVGVWAGNTNYEPMRNVNGLTGAAPIWHEFMRTVLADTPKRAFVQPDGLVQEEICALSGLIPTQACTYRRREWFLQGTQPTKFDSFYREVVIDQRTGRLATVQTPVNERKRKIVLDLPPQAWSWAHAQGITLYSDLQPDYAFVDEGGNSGEGMETMEITSPELLIVSPGTGSTYFLTNTLPAEKQKILLEAVGLKPLQRVEFWVDNQKIGSAEGSPFKIWWTLKAGAHQIQARGLTFDGDWILSPVIDIQVNG